jgi:hypothetical protein
MGQKAPHIITLPGSGRGAGGGGGCVCVPSLWAYLEEDGLPLELLLSWRHPNLVLDLGLRTNKKLITIRIMLGKNDPPQKKN